jgi:hypothetical protein
MAYYDQVRRLMEMERRRPPGVELDTPGVTDPNAGGTYGNPFSGQRGSLAGGGSKVTNPMGYFSQGPQGGPGSPQGAAMLTKLMQPLPNKSTMQDNAMGAIQGFMQMGGGGGMGGGMSTEGLGAGAGSFGGAEGGVGAFAGDTAGTSLGTNYDIPSAGNAAAFDPGFDMGTPSPPPNVPDMGTFEADKTDPTAGAFSAGPGYVPPTMTSPTEHSAYQEQLRKLVSGQSPASYFAKQMGATPAQQATAKMIEQTLMTHRKKGQAGMNAGRIAAMFA